MAEPSWFLDEVAGPPRTGRGMRFDEEWQGRVFAMAVIIEEQGVFTWGEFRECLETILPRRHDRTPDEYYTSWLHTLETLVVEKNVCTAAELATRLGSLDVSASGRRK